MACEPNARPLQDLSKHLNSTTSSSTSTIASPSASFRSSPSTSKRHFSLTSANRRSSSGESDFRSFLRSSESSVETRTTGSSVSYPGTRNQISSMPPLSQPFHSFHSNPSPKINSLEMKTTVPKPLSRTPVSLPSTSRASSSYTESELEDLSPFWNPEAETRQFHLDYPSPVRLPHASHPIFSTPPPRTLYNAPTAEEAISISSTPPTSCSRSSIHTLSKQSSRSHVDSYGFDNDVVGASATPPHSLTFVTPSHSAWDFDKLFSGRRRWFGGVRVPSAGFEGQDGEEEEILSTSNESGSRADLEGSAEGSAVERGRGINQANSLRGRSHSSLRNEFKVGNEGDSELKRQKEAYEELRKVAMRRLQAVGGHLHKGE